MQLFMIIVIGLQKDLIIKTKYNKKTDVWSL